MYNILSLDGGGSWAIIQVMTLQKLYGDDAPGSHVLKNFDLVVANSGGSIVAAALFLDMKLSTIRALFESRAERRKLFVSLPFGSITTLAGLGPRYEAAAKLAGLRAVFGADSAITLDQAAERINTQNKKPRRSELLIVGYQYDRDRAKFFRSNPASLASGSGSSAAVTLAEAVHASTNAPINYFEEPAKVRIDGRDVLFWDGGVTGFNNPVLAGLTEAKANGIASADIHVLSLGTGNTFLPLARCQERRIPVPARAAEGPKPGVGHSEAGDQRPGGPTGFRDLHGPRDAGRKNLERRRQSGDDRSGGAAQSADPAGPGLARRSRLLDPAAGGARTRPNMGPFPARGPAGVGR